MGQHDKTIERVLPVSNRPLQHNDINVGNKRSQRGQHVDAHNGQGLGLLPNDDQLLVPTMDAVTHPNKRLHEGGGGTDIPHSVVNVRSKSNPRAQQASTSAEVRTRVTRRALLYTALGRLLRPSMATRRTPEATGCTKKNSAQKDLMRRHA